MTVIKNHFEVFLVTSKKQGNGIIDSKVGLYSIKKASSHIHICQLNVSRGQDSMSGIVLTDIYRSFLRISKVTEKIKTSSKPTPSENFNSHPLFSYLSGRLVGTDVKSQLLLK
jgi:hypothetical protein